MVGCLGQKQPDQRKGESRETKIANKEIAMSRLSRILMNCYLCGKDIPVRGWWLRVIDGYLCRDCMEKNSEDLAAIISRIVLVKELRRLRKEPFGRPVARELLRSLRGSGFPQKLVEDIFRKQLKEEK